MALFFFGGFFKVSDWRIKKRLNRMGISGSVRSAALVKALDAGSLINCP
ncbi:hypothetical protein MRBLMR1_003586 [Neorhizobium sp. LMR1-1-1.1]